MLPNNNLLVTESEEGHVFELDPNREVVWEWWHPEMFDDPSKKNYGKRHDIYRAMRGSDNSCCYIVNGHLVLFQLALSGVIDDNSPAFGRALSYAA